MIALIISGLPASGKGTQCEKIASSFDLRHIDTGKALRHEVEKKSELGQEAKEYISEGKLVPNPVIKTLIEKEIEGSGEEKGFVFDGFPRSVEQAAILDDLGREKQLEIQGMICLETEEDELIERIRKRAEESGRKDDQDPNVVRSRIAEQKKLLKPLAEFYKKKDKLYPVDGSGTIDEVFERVKRLIEQHDLVRD